MERFSESPAGFRHLTADLNQSLLKSIITIMILQSAHLLPRKSWVRLFCGSLTISRKSVIAYSFRPAGLPFPGGCRAPAGGAVLSGMLCSRPAPRRSIKGAAAPAPRKRLPPRICRRKARRANPKNPPCHRFVVMRRICCLARAPLKPGPFSEPRGSSCFQFRRNCRRSCKCQ